MQLLRLAIKSPRHSTKHNLENAITRKGRPTFALEGHRVDDISHIFILRNISQIVIKLLQVPSGHRITPDLEELHANLPCRGIELVQFLRSLDESAFNVIRGLAVGDTDDVDGLFGLRLGCVLSEVFAEDLVESLAGERRASGSYGVEDFLHAACAGHVEVFVFVVEEVDVNTVCVVSSADWRDGHKSVGCLSPEAACHGSGVVDEEDGVESVQERVLIISYICYRSTNLRSLRSCIWSWCVGGWRIRGELVVQRVLQRVVGTG